MRALGVLTIVVILVSWAFGIAAAIGPDVENLPGHDITVRREACLSCHMRQIEQAPPMNHPATPTCGFCHLQGLPPAGAP
jgi:nitrate reductase cytochrome c-type subunit